jgi:glycosyltransferase involved in cell wall biosynthesis
MPKNRPIFSIVIPAFNEEKFLPRCLESLKNQDFKDFEIIVVDNNSTDKTADIAKKFGVTLLFEKNQGPAFARQKGFLNAKGKIIATTDADTILPKNWLSRIFEEFKKDKDLVAFGGSCDFYSGPISLKLASKFLLKPFLLFDKLISGSWSLMGCNMAIKKEAFFKVGGFNTSLKLNEDVEISHRLSKVGKVTLDPKFKVKTSGRRYRNGLIVGLSVYFLPTISRLLFKKYGEFQKTFPPVRKEEESLFGRLSFPIISFLILSFLLFRLSTPKVVMAKNFLAKNLTKVKAVEIKIKNGIKNDFWKFKNLKFRHEKNFYHL